MVLFPGILIFLTVSGIQPAGRRSQRYPGSKDELGGRNHGRKIIRSKNLRTEFKRDKTWVTAVNNVSFSIQPGEILGLVGESGCGKSVTSLSIMKLLARNSKISNGEILLNGKDLLKEDKKGMRKIRGREVAMIFQEPMNSLNHV